MSDNLPYCRIQGNADIAGVGIRASLYIQAGLGPLIFFFSITAGDFGRTETNSEELELKRYKLIDEIGLTLLLTGAALITSTLIEAKTADSGLSPYHTSLVLNLSWLNNVTGFTLHFFSFANKGSRPILEFGSLRQRKIEFVRTFWAFTLHCLIMSIAGIWFWADPNSFSRIPYDQPCIPITYFWLFSRIPIPNDKLRIVSLIAYSAIGIPIVNIIIHSFPWIVTFLAFSAISDTAVENCLLGPWFLLFLATFIGPTVFFITSTEMLIAANAEFVDHVIEEKWTFGQTLAIFLAAVSVSLTLGHLIEQRREQKREARKAKMEKSGIGISKGASGIEAASQGRGYKARDVGPQILTPDEESLGFSW